MRCGNPTNEHEPTNHSRASSREELARYKAMRVPAEHSSPLEFWKENGREFPVLAEVARRILCISASSAQSERDFSAVSRTITDARSRLSLKTVEAMELIRWAVRGSLLNMDD